MVGEDSGEQRGRCSFYAANSPSAAKGSLHPLWTVVVATVVATGALQRGPHGLRSAQTPRSGRCMDSLGLATVLLVMRRSSVRFRQAAPRLTRRFAESEPPNQPRNWLQPHYRPTISGVLCAVLGVWPGREPRRPSGHELCSQHRINPGQDLLRGLRWMRRSSCRLGRSPL